MENLESLLETHHRDAFPAQKLKKCAEEFSRNGYLKFDMGELIPAQLFDQVIAESDQLLEEHSIRRDVKVASTGYSKRFMSNVTAQGIRDHGAIINALYKSPALRGLLGRRAFPDQQTGAGRRHPRLALG